MDRLIAMINGGVSFGEAAAIHPILSNLDSRKHEITIWCLTPLFPETKESVEALFPNTQILNPRDMSDQLKWLRAFAEDVPESFLVCGAHTALWDVPELFTWQHALKSFRSVGAKVILLDTVASISYPNCHELDWPVLTPRPLTFDVTYPRLFPYKLPKGENVAGVSQKEKVLWAGSSISSLILGEQVSRKMEETSFEALANLESSFEFWFTPSSIEHAFRFMSDPKCIDQKASYEEVDRVLQQMSFVLCPNKVSTLAARAVNYGVPTIYLEPERDSIKELKLELDTRDWIPVPKEFVLEKMSLTESSRSYFDDLISKREGVATRLDGILKGQEKLPSPVSAFYQALELD